MARLVRGAGVLPLVAGVAAATALSGAAVFTVTGAGCGAAGNYVVDHGTVHLVGGCVTSTDLRAAPHARAVPDERALPEREHALAPRLKP